MRDFKIFAVGIGALLGILHATSSSAKPTVLRGAITDEAASPLPKVVIQLACHVRGKELTLGRTESKADGRFEFEAVLQHGCELKIVAPGFASVTKPIPDSPRPAIIDVGTVRLRVSCSGPGVICDEATPTEGPRPPVLLLLDSAIMLPGK
jgi:hypothetical protein